MTVLASRPPLAWALAAPLSWPGAHPLMAPVAALPPHALASLGPVGLRPLDVSALARVRPALRRQVLSLRAGMAELVLLNRLRARTRRELDKDVLERAARVIEVTADSWAQDGWAV